MTSESLIHALDAVTWYNGLAEEIIKWKKFKENQKIKGFNRILKNFKKIKNLKEFRRI